jgi:hypothetical protein
MRHQDQEPRACVRGWDPEALQGGPGPNPGQARGGGRSLGGHCKANRGISWGKLRDTDETSSQPRQGRHSDGPGRKTRVREEPKAEPCKGGTVYAALAGLKRDPLSFPGLAPRAVAMSPLGGLDFAFRCFDPGGARSGVSPCRPGGHAHQVKVEIRSWMLNIECRTRNIEPQKQKTFRHSLFLVRYSIWFVLVQYAHPLSFTRMPGGAPTRCRCTTAFGTEAAGIDHSAVTGNRR